ncbi:MAG: nucleotide sugar dehydrogenase, partial [Pseudomonadota bacterium]
MLDMTNAPKLRQELRIVTDLPTISVVGLGYVGAVSTACLGHLGHKVIGVDIDTSKTEAIAAGGSPIHEAQLEELLTEGVNLGLVSTTTELTQAVIDSDITFVSVGTPTAGDGGCDTTYIRKAARAIGRGIASKSDFHVVVMRCSIPPGTTEGVMVSEIEDVSGLKAGIDFGVCFNPEFLREGVAVADFHEPPKTVIGASDPRTARIVAKIYDPVDRNPILTTIETAEMVKYVDNVWHATKVCFGNEIGRL